VLQVELIVALSIPPQVLVPIPLLIAAETRPETTAHVLLWVPIRTTSRTVPGTVPRVIRGMST